MRWLQRIPEVIITEKNAINIPNKVKKLPSRIDAAV
jgi:hypothetical protein